MSRPIKTSLGCPIPKKGIAFVFAALPALLDDVLNNKISTFLQRAERHVLAEILLVETRDAYVDVVASAGKKLGEDGALLVARESKGICICAITFAMKYCGMIRRRLCWVG